MELINKKCVPCEGGSAVALASVEVNARMGEIPGWVLGHDGKSIERVFVLKNFVACIDLINKIKVIAEDEMHHPDLHLIRYKNLKVVLYTHALGGVTENDFILAAKINNIV